MRLTLLVLLMTIGALLLAPASAASYRRGWVPTWTTSPEPADPDSAEPLLHLQDQTVRERVRVSISGAQIRLRLSNEFGTAPLRLGSVAVAMPLGAAGIRPGTLRAVTFGGRASVTLAPGAPLLSDPVSFAVGAGSEISISIYFPDRVTGATWHALALKHAVVSGRGDHIGDTKIDGGEDTVSSVSVTAVLVPAKRAQRVVIAFGDSLVDGDASSIDQNRNWPSALSRRLRASESLSTVAVANEGIAGNRLLRDGPVPSLGAGALARLDRDALSLPGATHIILLEGVNDLGFPGAKLGGLSLADAADARSASDLIGAYRQIIARAHARGIKVIGCTLMPFEGVTVPGYYSDAKEAVRERVNRWIRSSAAFDGVIDFDKALRDPRHPSRLVARFASTDHLHPNDAGYQAMADAVDLSLFN